MEIGGKPLISWSIVQALESIHVNRVIVSTEDTEIASIAQEYGAEVPFVRPSEYAEDLSPDIDVFRHALEFLAQSESYHPEVVVHLRPTVPARRVDDIDSAVRLLQDHPEADSVRSVSLAHQTPYKMWRPRDDGTMEPLLRIPELPDCQSRARQSLPLVYAQNGYVDVVRPRAVLEMGSMCGERVLPLLMDTVPLDLDYPEDIAPVEAALKLLEEGLELPREPEGRHSV